MYPLLATAAASAAGNIIQTIADRVTQGPAKTAAAGTAQAVPFSTLVDKASAPTAATQAARSADLSSRLTKSPEVAAAANAAGVAGPASLQIDADGNTALRLPNGNLKPVQLSEELRGVARELNQLRQPPATSASLSRPASPVTVNL